MTDHPGLTIINIMNEITLDGTILYGAAAAWRSGDNVSTGVSVSGFRTFDEAKETVIKQAMLLGWRRN